MKKVIERIVESPGAPNENDLWLNGNELKRFKNGEWVAISGGNSGGGDDSDSDIQVVELTYDHLPATGTLSASDLAKLDSDNCLLVMNGKYFRKTFSSDGGIDYKEMSLTTVLGGVRSIYFTASKPDGEYTIAYTYLVEANTQTQATTALENIKVGNTTYSVPAVINVPGAFSGTMFSATLSASGEQGGASDEATLWRETANAFMNGATINLVVDGNYYRVLSLENIDAGGGVTLQTLMVFSAYLATTTEQQSPLGGWFNPDSMPSPTPSDPAH